MARQLGAKRDVAGRSVDILRSQSGNTVQMDPSVFMDPFAFPSVVWRDQIALHLDAVDILHASQTSTNGRETMWSNFKKVMKGPKFYAKRMYIRFAVGEGSFLSLVPPLTIPPRDDGHLSQCCAPNVKKEFVNTSRSRFMIFEKISGVIAQVELDELVLDFSCDEWLTNERIVRELKEQLGRLPQVTSLILFWASSLRVMGATHLFSLAKCFSEEILTRQRMRCSWEHRLHSSLVGDSVGGFCKTVHLPLLAHLEEKKRELGEKCLYTEIQSVFNFDPDNHNYRHPASFLYLSVELRASPDEPHILEVRVEQAYYDIDIDYGAMRRFVGYH